MRFKQADISYDFVLESYFSIIVGFIFRLL